MTKSEVAKVFEIINLEKNIQQLKIQNLSCPGETFNHNIKEIMTMEDKVLKLWNVLLES